MKQATMIYLYDRNGEFSQAVKPVKQIGLNESESAVITARELLEFDAELSHALVISAFKSLRVSLES